MSEPANTPAENPYDAWPLLPAAASRQEAIDSFRELLDDYYRLRKKQDPSFSCNPDMDRMVDYLEEHGFPKPDDEIEPLRDSNGTVIEFGDRFTGIHSDGETVPGQALAGYFISVHGEPEYWSRSEMGFVKAIKEE